MIHVSVSLMGNYQHECDSCLNPNQVQVEVSGAGETTRLYLCRTCRDELKGGL
jgi:hypothetical protein